MKLLITGGSGFIGSAVARNVIRSGGSVVNVDKMTYAATEGSTSEIASSERYAVEVADIVEEGAMVDILLRHRPDRLMHLAAETHVDRSIDKPSDFVMTNIVGTSSLLSACLTYYETLRSSKRDGFRFHHVSTDEVFGALGETGKFNLHTPYDPRSPYSASKASADHLVRSWYHTYGLPIVVSNCSNNYGPYQFPEKLIPLIILRAISGLSLPVYGTGENVRDWLFVEDHASALLRVADAGEVGQTYLIGGDAERRNIDVVRELCRVLDELQPADDVDQYEERITFVPDRPGHDYRYAIDTAETTRRLDWYPETRFEDGLARTAEWYLANKSWWRPLLEGTNVVERVGAPTEQESSL
jgi:dTDP-glucose 4,6-dehydratase